MFTPSAERADDSPVRRPPSRRVLAELLLVLVCLLVYNSNLRTIGAGDTLPARYQPIGIWRYGTLRLDPIVRLVAHGHPSLETWSGPPSSDAPGTFFEPWAFWITTSRDGRLVSLYPVVAPVLVAPLYLPAVLYLRTQGWQPWQVDWGAAVMEKLSASLLAALTVWVVYMLLRRDVGRWALPLAFAFAFGTNTWMTSSQALWQHGAGELFVALSLLLVTSPLTPARCAALGVACAAMTATRPPDALLAAALVLCAVYAVWKTQRVTHWLWLMAGGVIPVGLLLIYNLSVTGRLIGGYGAIAAQSVSAFFAHSTWVGLAALLLNPMRGLLVFSPFLVFVPLGLLLRFRAPGSRGLAVLLAIAVVAQLVLYAKADWRAGTAFGPRWLTDMLPILMWMLAPAAVGLRSLGRGVLFLAIAVAMSIQAIGAFWYAGVSDQVLYASDRHRGTPAWRLTNAPFVAELRHARQHGDLACSARGYLDLVGTQSAAQRSEDPVPVIAHGARLSGWALACGRSPAQVFLLADGLAVGRTTRFTTRHDVESRMRTTAPSGWTVAADTHGLAPGEHVLQVAVRAEPLGDVRIVSESLVRVLMEESPSTPSPSVDESEPRNGVTAGDLAPLAQRAAELVRKHQNAAGYWLTAYTTATKFESPAPEMNTFLTAMVVDLLTPIAARYGLENPLEKGRRHLAAQIEPDGLVRYHGRPEGPTIGTLGCAITPDADDTALAWRIASPPADDPRRAPMLRTLEKYRDARGLYRTWLAPQDRYQCIDPGRDPDPADIAIQMHVLLLLAKIDHDAAVPLCQALARHVSDDSLWVYYARAPLVPLLRITDLRRIGCGLELPGQRLAGVPGQEAWIAATRRLVYSELDAPGARSSQERRAALELLAALGRDDFAELRRTPPLLYHNDLTATVSRYYWSEDFGYALWLRLYEATRAAAPSTGSPR